MTVQSSIKLYSKLRPQERRQTDASDLIVCPTLSYAMGNDEISEFDKMI